MCKQIDLFFQHEEKDQIKCLHGYLTQNVPTEWIIKGLHHPS